MSSSVSYSQPYPDEPNWAVSTSWPDGRNYPLFFVAHLRYIVDSNGNWVPRAASGSLPAKPRTESLVYGTDVSSFWRPSSASYLYGLLPNRQVRKIFPLPSHAALIDRPIGIGAVIEPNMSPDAEWIYFSYFHDVTQSVYQSLGTPVYGADIYRIYVKPLIDNPNIDPATLTVQRVTNQLSPINDPENQTRFAINPSVSSTSLNLFGGFLRLSPVVIEDEEGEKLLYSTNERRVSSATVNRGEEQMALFAATLDTDGSIITNNPYQYFITSSWISSFNTRNGIGGNYSLGIDTFGRHWQTQLIESGGQWYPGSGYGGPITQAVHNSTMISTNESDSTGEEDFIVDTSYYGGASNNNGFGALIATGMYAFVNGQPLNTKFVPGNALLSYPVDRRHLTLGVDSDQDLPSQGTVGNWVGKFTTPRGGDVGRRELYAAYTPSCAHNRFATACTESIEEQNIYRSHIILRTLEQGNPQPWHPLTPGAMQTIVDDTNDYFSLLWPTPVIPLHQSGSGPKRFGGQLEVEPKVSHAEGLAASVIGSSSLDHTDIVPPECRTSNQKFKPTSSVGSMAILSKVRDRNNMSATCDTALLPENVLGVAILQTDNKIDRTRHANTGRHELTRLIGVIDVLSNPNGDTSFAALIPSNIPFKFEILDSETGYKLTDQLSWHSELAGERRTDCGGCHEHTKPGIPWASKIASTTQYEIPDLRTYTPYVDYDENCSPIMQLSNTPTREQDIWGQTSYLFQGMQNYCQDCHRSGGSGESAFSVTNASETLNVLRSKSYVYPLGGANSSPAVWAGHGRRLDGRDNNDVFFQPNFVMNEIHADPSAHPNTARCSKNDLAFAQWLYRFGRWVDNYIPNEDSFPQSGASWTVTLPAEFDRFHPTINGALTSGKPSCDPAQGLTVDAWDDSNQLSSVTIEFSNNFTESRTNVANGIQMFGLEPLQNADDWVKVTATDQSGNRQTYKKTLEELLFDCQIAQDPLNEQSIRQPGSAGSGGPNGSGGGSPSPTPETTPTPSPTPETTPTPSESPESTPDPDAPGSSTLQISQNLLSAKKGDHVRLIVTSSHQSLAGKRFCIGGSISGTLPAESASMFSLLPDNYTTLSLSNYCSTLELNLEGTLEGHVDLIVPDLRGRAGSEQKKEYITYHQAVISGEDLFSSVSELVLINTKKKTKRARGALPEMFRKLAKKKKRLEMKLEVVSKGNNIEASKRMNAKLKEVQQELRSIKKLIRAAKKLGKQVIGQATKDI